MEKFYTIRELSQPREIYSDPFMQNVRDKTDLLALARKCMEGFEVAFGDLFSSVQDDISKRTDTGDIFYTETRSAPYAYGTGVDIIRMTVSNDGRTLTAGTYLSGILWKKQERENDG